jgi:GNAT superfamily N-acetyltransferase
MGTDLEIRPATPHDVGVVLNFIRRLAEYEKLSHSVSVTEDELREALFGALPGAEVLLAYVNGTPAGFAVYFHTFSTVLGRRGMWLEDLFVDPAMRGRGVGKRLLLAVARIAHERGCGRFEWAVLDWNTAAWDFYRALGAAPLDDWTTFRVSGPELEKLARM